MAETDTSNEDSLALELVTEPRAPRFVTIDGEKYRLRDPLEFGLVDLARVEVVNGRLASWQDELAAHDIDPKRAEAISAALSEFVMLTLVGVSAKLAAKLPDGEKLKLLRFFSAAGGKRSTTSPAEPKPSAEQPGSNGSTEATPLAG